MSLSLAKKSPCQALYEIHFMHKLILFTKKQYAKQKYNKNCFGDSQKCFIIHRQYLLSSNKKNEEIKKDYYLIIRKFEGLNYRLG